MIALYVFIGLVIGFVLAMILFKKLALKQAIKENARQSMNGILIKTKRDFYPTFSPFINSISPQFVKIYDDCLVAENYELNDIVGISYGKSLEFLIRDYAISKNPSEKENILKARLVDCINNYISDTSIKDSSDIARWLRNDETHYKRKYENADVSHLKQLIQLTVALINAEHEKKQIDNEVQKIKLSIKNP